ncbi:hypothetical protein BFG51_08050 [Dietzia alimentaria]|jgi:hypothetical protein|nr:hypothetical protein BFG51_08050 [Dietzia alimentaria]
MEPMRPVDVGRQDPPRPWWQRWGWPIYASLTILLVATLHLTVDIPLWAGASISVGLGVAWMAIESVLARRSKR